MKFIIFILFAFYLSFYDIVYLFVYLLILVDELIG